MHTKIPQALIERSGAEAPWLKVAFAEQGITEYHGLAANNPRVLEYISSFPNLAHIKHMVKDPKTHKKVASGYKMSEVDETAWCSCFVALVPSKIRPADYAERDSASGQLAHLRSAARHASAPSPSSISTTRAPRRRRVDSTSRST